MVGLLIGPYMVYFPNLPGGRCLPILTHTDIYCNIYIYDIILSYIHDPSFIF